MERVHSEPLPINLPTRSRAELIHAEKSSPRIIYKLLTAVLQMPPEGLGRSKRIEQHIFLSLGYTMKNLCTTIKTRLSACLVAAAFVATPSFAATPIECKNTDISPNAIDCRGFVFGNVIGSPSSETLLAELGYFGSAKPGIETLVELNGLTTINFSTLLFGETVIGVHYGNGDGSPGNPDGPVKGDGDDTAFYKFDAGTAGLDTFTLNYGASSNVRLYKTGVGAVPEPSTWMFMLLGMTGVGFALRRKDKQTLRVRYT